MCLWLFTSPDGILESRDEWFEKRYKTPPFVRSRTCMIQVLGPILTGFGRNIYSCSLQEGRRLWLIVAPEYVYSYVLTFIFHYVTWFREFNLRASERERERNGKRTKSGAIKQASLMVAALMLRMWITSWKRYIERWGLNHRSVCERHQSG